MLIGLDGLPFAVVRTGVGHYTFELGRALAAESPADEFQFLYPSTYPPVESEDHLPENLTFRRIHVGLLGRRWWSVGLPKYIRRNRLQLFHGTNYEIPVWKNCPTVLTIHDLSPLLYPQTHTRRTVRRARRRLPIMARAANAIITPTTAVRAEVCDHLSISPERVFAVPEAARTSFSPMTVAETRPIRERLGVGDRFYLAVGTIEPRKNLITLVNAFEEVSRVAGKRDVQLVVAGNCGWLSGPILTAIENSAVHNRILLTGYLNDTELRALYSSCLAFIYPSLYEGFGLPPLEAMACGAAVVASDIAALRETLGQAATFVPARDVKGLAQALIEVDDEDAKRSLSARGLVRASEFSWQRTAQSTLEVYRHALRKKDSWP